MHWISLRTPAAGLVCLLMAAGTPALKLSAQSEKVAEALNAPSVFQSQLRPCPAECTTLNPNDWTVYPSFERVSYCHEPVIFDFAIHTPVDDPSKTLRFRACTAGDRNETTTVFAAAHGARPSSDSVYDASLIRESKVRMQTMQETTSLKSTSNHVAVTLANLQSYLLAGEDLTKGIILGYYEGIVVGVYIGQAFSRATAQSVINHILQAEESAPPASITQLCGDDRDRQHVFGIAISDTGDLAAVQAALVSWSKGECATGSGKSATSVPNISIWEVSQNRGSSTPSSNSTTLTTSHVKNLVARDAKYCEKRTVVLGDTCPSLAKACGITLDQFYEYNSKDICPKLKADQKVCCTSGSLTPQPYDNGTCYTYKTQADDNCYELSKTWSLTQDEIAKFNDGTTWGWNGCDDLGAGLNICLSKGDPPLPAVIPNAVCGPQAPGTSIDGSITNASDLANLNPCPLNSCCNIWGHCGIDSSFCTESKGPTGNPGTSKPGVFGCISNCGTDIVNNEEGPSAGYQRVGYYETFNWDRECLHMRAEWSNTLNYTHMHWAFGGIGEDLSVYINNTYEQWDGFKSLKNVKKIVSFGGWGFSTEGSTYDVLRRAMEPANRVTFVKNMVAFAQAAGVDGIDIDWEYPGAPDIPGIPPGLESDAPNYLATLKALRKELPEEFSLSIAAPASYWYLKAFPIKDMAETVDYIVYMAYDLHGQWDYGNINAQSGCESGNCLRSHVNETEVRSTLAMITKAGVKTNKIMVGESSYGRSFKMAEAGCTGPNCFFTGTNATSNAKPGRCTNTGGYLANAEINEIISKRGDSVRTWYDDESASDYIVYGDLEWVAYMGANTKQARRDTWEKLNFAGTIDWAVDLQDFNLADTVGNTGDYDQESCINIFDNMIWDWANPVIEAPEGCTNLIQASPLATTVTRTAYTTLTLVSGGTLSTTVVSTVFPISEVNYQPFTLASTDTVSDTVITYRPIPRVTPNPMSVTVPQGWTVTSPGGSVDGPSATTPTLVGPPNAGATTTTSTTTTHEAGFLMWITWLPTVAYSLPSIVTPKLPAPTRIPDDDSSPTPTPSPGVTDCVGDTCTEGPDCTNSDCTRGGDCTGPKCIRGGKCSGKNCVRGGTCIGENCANGGDCEGDGCVTGGGCSGSKCHQGGRCSGKSCNSGGGCVTTLLHKCSPGACTGPGCKIDFGCPACDNKITITVHPGGGSNPKPTPRPTCLENCPKLPPCPGGGTECNTPCNAKRCPAQSMPTDKACTSLTTVDACTEIISSTAVQTSPVTSYSTTTRTRCDKTADCDAQDMTVTTTITTSHEPDPTVMVTGIYDYWEDGVDDRAVFESIASEYDEWERTADIPFPTTTSTTGTTTSTAGPTPTAADGCAIMDNVQGVCWNKCDPATGQAVDGVWEDGDPWCWLKDDDIGAFCNHVEDCPSEFQCQPSDWPRGGCKQPEPVSGGCAIMGGTQGVCWSKCDPATSEPVEGQWKKGDPWCWLKDDDIGAFCNHAEDCPANLQCQPSSWEYGGCSTNTPLSRQALMLAFNGTSSAITRPQGLRLDIYY